MAADFGRMVAQLLLDDKQFVDGLKNAVTVAATSGKRIGDLLTVKVPPLDLSAIDKEVELLNKRFVTGQITAGEYAERLVILSQAESDARAATLELGAAHDETTGKTGTAGAATDDLTQRIKRFREEQRLENFVTRQSTQLLTGLTSVIGFFSVANQDAEGTTKRVSSSLLAGVSAANAMQFALFALSTVAARAGGGLGTFLGGVVRLAGPIGLTIGAIVTLISLFTKVDEEAKKTAEEGVKDLLDALRKLGEPVGGSLSATFIEESKARISAIDEEIGRLRDLQVQRGAGGVPGALLGADFGKEVQRATAALDQEAAAVLGIEGGIQRQVERLQQERADLESITSEWEEQIRQQEILDRWATRRANLIALYGNDLEKLQVLEADINRELQLGVNLINGQALSAEDVAKRRQVLADIEAQRTRSTRTQIELARDNVTLTETQYRLGQVGASTLIGALETLKSHTREKADQLVIDERIRAIRQEVREAEFALGRATRDQIIQQLESEKATAKRAGNVVAEAAAQEQIISLLQSEAAESELLVGLNERTVRQHIDLLTSQLDIVAGTQQELTLRAQINAFTQQLLALEQQRETARRASVDRDRVLVNENLTRQQERELALIRNVFDQRKRAEEIRHANEVSDIEAFYARFPDLEERRRELDEETALNRQNLAEIEVERELARIDERRFFITSEHELVMLNIELRYAEEQAQIEALFADKEQREEALSALRKRKANEELQAGLASAQRLFGTTSTLVQNIGTLLKINFQEAGSGFVNNLLYALRIAQAIATVIQSISIISGLFGASKVPTTSLGGGGGGPRSLDSGGFTGEGPADEPAGIVHKGEIVFEKPIVDRHKSGLLALRSVLQRGYQEGGLVGGGAVAQLTNALVPTLSSGVSISEFGVLVEEIRGLREDVQQVRDETRGVRQEVPERINLRIPSAIELRADGRELRSVIRRDELLDQ